MTMVGIFFLINSLFIVTALMTMRWRTVSDRVPCTQNSSSGNAAPESKRRAKLKRGLGGASIIKDCLSFVCSVDGKAKNVVMEFPNFTPLPWYKGKLSVAFSVAVSMILLSRFVLGGIGVDPTATSVELCSTANSERRMLEMEETLQNITHLDYARNASDRLAAFYDALVADTALYGVNDGPGTGDFTCPDATNAATGSFLLSGDKEDWKVPTAEPALSNGAFFPGFCAGALEASIQSAKERKCTERVCACKKIFGRCWGGATRQCFDNPIPCKVHAKDVDDEAALNSYRKQQVLRAAEQDLGNFTETPGVPDVADAAAAELAEMILFQVDVASLLYVSYALVGLFIPVPLVFYKSPLMTRVKRAAFGADKNAFVLIVLAIWWGYAYFREILFSPDLAIYFRNLQLDPCYVDPEFLLARRKMLADTCSELSAMSNEFPLNSMAVDDILTEVDFFTGQCRCGFPNVHMMELALGITRDEQEELGFTRILPYLGTVLAPMVDMEFPGNLTVCEDQELAKSLFLTASDTDANWVELWFATGIVASLFAKLIAANFAFSALLFFDPLSGCDGRFEIPPGVIIDAVTMDGVRQQKTGVIKAAAARGLLIWGLLFQAMLIIIVQGGVTDVDDANADADNGVVKIDTIVGWILVATAVVVVPAVGLHIVKKTTQGARHPTDRQPDFTATETQTAI